MASPLAVTSLAEHDAPLPDAIKAHGRDWRRMTQALCLGSFLVFINLYLVQPILPLLASDLKLSSLQASLTLSVSTLMLAVALLVFGPLSDALGRRRILLWTLAGGVACSGLALLADGFWSLLTVRALQGFLLGGLPAVAVAYMSDEMERPALMAAVGLYISANSLGGITGRVAGGFVAEHWGWQASFAVVGVFSLLALGALWQWLPRQRRFVAQPLNLASMLAGLGRHLRNPRLWPVFLFGGLNFFIFVNLYSYMTFRLSAVPWSLGSQWLGLLFLTYLAGTFGASQSGKLAQRLARLQQAWRNGVKDREKGGVKGNQQEGEQSSEQNSEQSLAAMHRTGQALTMMLGTSLLIVGTLLTLSHSLIGMMIGLSINAFGFFLAHATASAWVGRNAEGARASASALYLTAYYLGASLGGFWLEPFWQAAGWPGVVVGGVLVLLITLGLAVYCWRSVATTQSSG
ncbi:MFS transporter [Cobetia crustatorum]|uniref:MFS transporter n=1 Tax=Cobetia crustatorum TaxID=553385 RepID=A0A558HJI2_9GAMM|nr:MFS transporter [Cobetia crustatorum]TVU69286.1 MFS transporter [Cobetia crustatorum]